jgi:hypothetical protein
MLSGVFSGTLQKAVLAYNYTYIRRPPKCGGRSSLRAGSFGPVLAPLCGGMNLSRDS